MTRLRELRQGQEPSDREVLVTIKAGKRQGQRLAITPKGHYRCKGTGCVVEVKTAAHGAHGDPKVCDCVDNLVCEEVGKGVSYEIDWRTPEQRQQARIDSLEEALRRMQGVAEAEVEQRRHGAREARTVAAKCAAETEVSAADIAQALENVTSARAGRDAAWAALKEAEKAYEAAKRLAAEAERLHGRLTKASGETDTTQKRAEATAAQLDAEANRLRAVWDQRILRRKNDLDLARAHVTPAAPPAAPEPPAAKPATEAA